MIRNKKLIASCTICASLFVASTAAASAHQDGADMFHGNRSAWDKLMAKHQSQHKSWGHWQAMSDHSTSHWASMHGRADTPRRQSIAEIAVGDSNFSTLVAAATQAGLVDTLTNDGPYTIFAPTNEAFEKLEPGVLDAVLADQELLTSILKYHIIPGRYKASRLDNYDTRMTLQGQDITITADDTIMINDATVTQADIKAKNGIIHVIDTVLLPQ